MGIKGFLFDGDSTPQKIDYNFLENAPCYSEYSPITDILETKEYEFVTMGDEGPVALMLELESLPPVIAGVPYKFIFDEIEEEIELTFLEDEGILVLGNMAIMSDDYENTGEEYFMYIGADVGESSYCVLVIATTKPAGTYTAGLSYVSENVPLILDGTYTFGSMGE